MKSLACLCFVIYAAGSAHAAWLGDGTRGGGNATVADFYAAGDAVIQALRPLSPVTIDGASIDVSAWERTFQLTKVYASDAPLNIQGLPVDAINEPAQNRIEFDQSRWLNLEPEQRTRLVVHELLGLLQIDDSRFALSRDIYLFAFTSAGLPPALAQSGEACTGTRTFTGPKAAGLASALRQSGIRPTTSNRDERFDAHSLLCSVSITPYADGLPRASCRQGPKDESKATLLTDALDHMGVFAEGEAGRVWFAADDITCTVATNGGSDVVCQLAASWAFGCDAIN